MKGTRSALYAMPLDGAPKLIHAPQKGTFFAGYGPNAHLNRTGDSWGFALESSDEAPEAYMAKLPAGAPVVVSRANLDLPKPPLGETKAIRWKSKDGQEIEGLLT